MEKLIGSFDTKRGHEQVRAYTFNSNGKTSLSIRLYSYRAGDWRLAKKSVTISGTKVYKLTKLIEKAAESMSAEKLATPTIN